MSLSGILNTGRNTLLAHQAALQVVSNNTANADTEGYSRQDVDLRSTGPLAGVKLASVRRRTESFLGGRLLAQNSQAGAQEAQAPRLEVLETMFTEEASGLGPRLDDFFNALRNLTTDPTDLQFRSEFLSRAKLLAETFRGDVARLDEQRSDVDRDMVDLTSQASSLTQEIATLNGRISELEGSGQEASDLRDRRDAAIQELSALVPISTFEDASGQVTVLLDGQYTLVQMDQAASFSTEPDANYGGYRRLDVTTPGGATFDITASLRSGRLGGQLALRDDKIPDVIAAVDQLAYDLATNMNAAHSAGYGLDGVTGRDLFQPPTLGDAARNLQLTAGMIDNPSWIAASTTAGQAVGGNDNILAMIDMETQKLAGGGTRTFMEEIGNTTAVVGRMSRDTQDALARANMQIEQLDAMRQSQIGVSLDEEMLDLTRFQRAYQAGARIVSTVDEMYQTLLNI